LSWFSSVF